MATQSECADWLDISDRRFRELVDEGVLERAPEKGGYDLKAVVQQYIRNLRTVAAGRGGGEAQAQKAVDEARLARARADKAEMELDEQRGQLVPADQIADALNDAVQIMRTRVMAIPTKAAPRVGARDVAHAEQAIRAEVIEALTELSKIEIKGAAGA